MRHANVTACPQFVECPAAGFLKRLQGIEAVDQDGQIHVSALVADLASSPAKLPEAGDLPLERPSHGPEQDDSLNVVQLAHGRGNGVCRNAKLLLPSNHP